MRKLFKWEICIQLSQTGDSNKATAQQYSGSSSITQIQNGDNNVALQTKMGSFMERMV
jgi:hypothetical protein